MSVRQEYYGQKLLDLCAKWLNDFEKHYVNENTDKDEEPPVVQWYRQYKRGMYYNYILVHFSDHIHIHF